MSEPKILLKARRNLVIYAQKLGVETTQNRVNTFKYLLKATNSSRRELARHLNISKGALDLYLNPNCRIIPSFRTLRKLENVCLLLGEGKSLRSRNVRFKEALNALVGEFLNEDGTVTEGRNVQFIALKLSEIAGGSTSTWYRYIGKIRNLAPSEALIQALEKAASNHSSFS
jgi:transcriptional regulator with XRE-family HTH domain